MPPTTGYEFSDTRGTVAISGFAPSGVTCASEDGLASVSYTECESLGGAYTVPGCESECTVPVTTGYDFAGAGRTMTISAIGKLAPYTGDPRGSPVYLPTFVVLCVASCEL